LLQVAYIFLSSLLIAQSVLAAPTNQDEEVSAQLQTIQNLEEKAKNSSMKLIGSIDVRPTASLKGQDSFRFENSADLGYQITPQFQMVYHQDFWMNLYNSKLVGGSDGVGLIAQDGFLDWFYEGLAKNRSEDVLLHYEGRLYAPTFSNRRDAGMITALRSYFILETKVSNSVSFNFIEAPIVHVYSVPSHNGRANPIVENRLGVQFRWKLSEKLAFSMPLNWSATRMREAAGAMKSKAIENFVWVNPELTYKASAQYSFGMAYYDTTSLIKSDFSAFQVGEGLEDGVVQLFLQASL